MPVVAAIPKPRERYCHAKESYQEYLSCGTPKAASMYLEVKHAPARPVTEARPWAWEEFEKTTKKDFY